MMKISKQSISYKFLTECWLTEMAHVPTNLCPYMRTCIGQICIVFFSYFCALWVAHAMLLAPFLVWINLSIDEVYAVAVLVLGALVDVGLVLAGIVYVITRIFKRAIPTSRIHRVVANTLVVQWIKAIHDKVCPTITFTSNKV